MFSLVAGLTSLLSVPLTESPSAPASLSEVRYRTSADKTLQPAFFYAPRVNRPVPLLVALHSWSADYRQKLHQPCAQYCIDHQWAYIHPHFRGPNNRPEATGSELVVKDILIAVDYARSRARIDPRRIYLVGTSGGGYTALLLAGRAPKVWAGVSAWVPITDLKAWHSECKKSKRKYWKDIELSCGGPPGHSTKVDQQYRQRSPLTHLHHARGMALDINAGIRDGHTGSVPVSHSLLAFNRVAAKKDQFNARDIAYLVKEAKVPRHLAQSIVDPAYGKKMPLLRRTSGKARLTLFDGGHELIPKAATQWLSKQSR